MAKLKMIERRGTYSILDYFNNNMNEYKPDFKRQLDDIFKKNKADINSPHLKNEAKIKKDIKQVWYNIHQRTTNGRVDLPVVLRVSLRDADTFIKNFLRPKVKHNSKTGKMELFFYEKVRQDGYRSNRYENDVKLFIENNDKEEDTNA